MFFFFNDTATTEIYTLSLHDALPISIASAPSPSMPWCAKAPRRGSPRASTRSEEHTSELQSLAYLVCRLLLEKKKDRGPVLVHPRPRTEDIPFVNDTTPRAR